MTAYPRTLLDDRTSLRVPVPCQANVPSPERPADTHDWRTPQPPTKPTHTTMH